MPPLGLAKALRALLATSTIPDLAGLLMNRPAAQQPMAAMAAHVLALPAGEQEAAVTSAKRCLAMLEIAQVLAADCLTAGRQLVGPGQRGGGGGGGGLLHTVAALLAQPQLLANRGRAEQGGLLLACLELEASLLGDELTSAAAAAAAAAAAQQGREAQFAAAHLHVLGGPGGLPLLCMLAGEMCLLAVHSSMPIHLASAALLASVSP